MGGRFSESRRRRILLRALLVVLSSALTLAFAEAAVRIFDLAPDFHVIFRENLQLSANRTLSYELAPGSKDGRSSISSAGLRDREFPRTKPGGAFRIAAIGDSITFGTGCPQRSAWPKRLEGLLERVSGPGAPGFEVLNFGVTGYNIAQIVERLRASALDYAPDLVVYGYSLNDPQRLNLEGQLSRAVRKQVEGSFDGGARRWLFRSRLFLLTRHVLQGDEPLAPMRMHVQADPEYTALRRNRGGEYFLGLHTRGEEARRFDRGIADLAGESRRRGVPVALAIFPLFPEPGTPYPAAEAHAHVARVARGHGFPVLDLRTLFRAAESRFAEGLRADLMHPSCFGHRLAAAALLAWLDGAGLLPAGAIDRARLRAGPPDEAWAAGALHAPE